MVVGLPGIWSAQTGVGYNFGTSETGGSAYGYVGVTAAMVTASASYSTSGGFSAGVSAGATIFSGLPVSTNFASVGINYNFSNNSFGGNLSAWSWQEGQEGFRFNPSVSAMVFPEQTTNLFRGQGFNINNTVLGNFVNDDKHQEALKYFGFEGDFINEEGLSSFYFDKKDPSKYGIRYRKGSFESYESLYSSYIKESFHMRRYEQNLFDLGNSGVMGIDRWPEERQGCIRQYKTRGLHRDKSNYLKSIRNTESMIDSYNDYGDYSPPYQYQPYTPQWWHRIYTIPRRW